MLCKFELKYQDLKLKRQSQQERACFFNIKKRESRNPSRGSSLHSENRQVYGSMHTSLIMKGTKLPGKGPSVSQE